MAIRQTAFLFKGTKRGFEAFMADINSADLIRSLGESKVKWLMDNNIVIISDHGRITLINRSENLRVDGTDLDAALDALYQETMIRDLAQRIHELITGVQHMSKGYDRLLIALSKEIRKRMDTRSEVISHEPD